MSDKLPPEQLAFRKRLWKTGRVVQTMFARFAKYDPTIWQQGAFMMLVGVVVDMLANQDELAADDLLKLSKVLSEANKLMTKPRAKSGKRGSKPDAADTVPTEADLGPIIRDLYGLNLEEVEATSES